MAKLTQPLGSSEARGKLGGLVYNTWRGIAYAKAKATPGNQGTQRRLAVRALAKACTTQWQTISDTLRTWWNDYAARTPDTDWTGNPKRLSGYNWFLRCNVRLLDIGLPINDLPPIRPNQWPALVPAASQADASLEITWTLPPSTPSTDLQVDVWITKAQSAGRKPAIEDAKHLAYEPAESGTYTTPPLGHGTYGIYLRTIDELTGLASPWALVIAAVTGAVPFSQGPSFPTDFFDLETAEPFWYDLAYLGNDDETYAEVDCDPGPTSDKALVNTFGFTIPPTATITGVVCKVDCYPQSATTIALHAQLYKDGLPISDEQVFPLTPETPELAIIGSSSDLWGAALTPAIVNDPSFGPVIWVVTDPDAAMMARYLTLTVYCTS